MSTTRHPIAEAPSQDLLEAPTYIGSPGNLRNAFSDAYSLDLAMQTEVADYLGFLGISSSSHIEGKKHTYTVQLPSMEQFNERARLLGDITGHGLELRATGDYVYKMHLSGLA